MAISTALMVGGIALAGVIILPFMLPSSKTVQRQAVIDAPASEIYQMIASSRQYQKFNPYRDTDPDLKIGYFGPENGIGAGFSFEGKEGKGTQTVTKAVENEQVTMLIDLGAMGKPVQTFTLEPQEGSTRVIWSTRSDFGMNPIGRVFGLFLDGMLGSRYEQGLANMQKALGNAA